MQITFDVFKYKEEYWEKLNTGIVSDEDDPDLEVDCYTEKMLINTDNINFARPSERNNETGRYTEVSVGQSIFIINVPFKDFIHITPHVSYAYLKSRWAN